MSLSILYLRMFQLVIATMITITVLIVLQLIAEHYWEILWDKIGELKARWQRARLIVGYQEVAKKYKRTVR